MSPFQSVTGVQPRLPANSVPLPIESRPSGEAKDFIRHMQHVHDEVQRHITASNDIYKRHDDAHRRFVEFAEGDMVMVRIRPKRLLPKANNKLHPRNAGPFKILKKISSNASILELPAELGISPTFNVEDLTLYHGHHIDEGIKEHIISTAYSSSV